MTPRTGPDMERHLHKSDQMRDRTVKKNINLSGNIQLLAFMDKIHGEVFGHYDQLILERISRNHR